MWTRGRDWVQNLQYFADVICTWPLREIPTRPLNRLKRCVVAKKKGNSSISGGGSGQGQSKLGKVPSSGGGGGSRTPDGRTDADGRSVAGPLPPSPSSFSSFTSFLPLLSLPLTATPSFPPFLSVRPFLPSRTLSQIEFLPLREAGPPLSLSLSSSPFLLLAFLPSPISLSSLSIYLLVVVQLQGANDEDSVGRRGVVAAPLTFNVGVLYIMTNRVIGHCFLISSLHVGWTRDIVRFHVPSQENAEVGSRRAMKGRIEVGCISLLLALLRERSEQYPISNMLLRLTPVCSFVS